MAETAVSTKTSESAAVGRERIQPFPPSRFFSLSPIAMMREASDEMERMFQGIRSGAALDAWVPTMDIQRCNGNLIVSAELPGLKKEDIKIEVSSDALVIEGERKQEHKEDHDGFHRYERSYGKFFRSVPLPEGAKADQVKAELTDGVLKISVPVPESKQKTRQVEISSQEGKK